MKKITNKRIDAIFGATPFCTRLTRDKRNYEVVQLENEDWATCTPNEEPKVHGIFSTYEKALKLQHRLHVRFILNLSKSDLMALTRHNNEQA